MSLAGLDQFKMKEDRNGVQTKELLYMEKSWDTAYLWENAEAALAYLEAFSDTKNEMYCQDAIAILRATAKHHHGEYGFLTEGVDWNNHVGAIRHFDGAEYGDIKYTEPLLNNLHIVEPTLLAVGLNEVVHGNSTPVEIFEVFVEEQRYPAERKGYFECSDERLNRLWKVGANVIRENHV